MNYNMKKLIAAVALLSAAVVVKAGCLVFEKTRPLTLTSGAVVYPISRRFPEVIQNCASINALLSPATNFLTVAVSSSCHQMRSAQPYGAVLVTDGNGHCGPALTVLSAQMGSWTNY
jgi:hypothetical protein